MTRDELITGAALALGLAGEFRKIGDDRMYVLHGPSWRRWGEYIFDPLDNGEHAFGVAGALEMSVGFGPTYALVKMQGASGPVVSEMYADHAGDRFVAGRIAIARCAILLYYLKNDRRRVPREPL